MASEGEIAVGQAFDKGFVVIRASGRCHAALCPSLRNYLERLVPPAVTDVYFDLSAATSIDSTFAGLLVSRVRKSAPERRPRAHLVNPSTRVRQALELMHVWRLFDVVDDPPAGTVRWRKLPQLPRRAEDIADLVIQAHETLIDADTRNKSTFGPIVNTFRDQRKDRNDEKH